RNGSGRCTRFEGADEEGRAAAEWIRGSHLQDRLRITDGRILHQRLSGEERQALHAPWLDHGEREGISSRPDEDRDPALENFTARLGRSARDESVNRAGESLWDAGERPQDQEPRRTFAGLFLVRSIQGLQLLRSAARREEGPPIGDRRSRRTEHGCGWQDGAGPATGSVRGRDLLDAVFRGSV